jgi:hypothetical protein
MNDQGRSIDDQPRSKIADLIERFVSGDVDPWDWDDFTSVPARDPEIEKVRLHCVTVKDKFPHPKRYCSDEGLRELLELARKLRGAG